MINIFSTYTVEFLDTKDHVYHAYVLIADSMETAIESAKQEAYKMISENKIVIRYVSVYDGNEQYVYNVLTKKIEKWC